jgi:leucyl/phenylalanyl-tRNA--protein transferase
VEPVFLEPGCPPVFPDPRRSDAEGLVAVGGDLSVPRLLAAYERGIFPWYDENVVPLWWSPDPRAVLPLEGLHVSRRLARRLRRGEFTLTWNRAFRAVMACCAVGRYDGTWILPEMIEAYGELNRLGHAHSIEVWAGSQLVGGLYGVQRGGLFAAESMFHRCTDASKVALVSIVRSLFRRGIELFDVQFLTPHLATMGARNWRREDYLRRLAEVRQKEVDLEGLEVGW